MAAGVEVLVPFRFITMVGHFIACILVFWTRGDHVRAALPLQHTTSQFEAQEASLVVALSLTMTVFAVELVGFWSGLTMFSAPLSFMHVVFHVAGAVSVCLFILQGAHADLYWVYFALFSALPGAVEMGSIGLTLSRKQW